MAGLWIRAPSAESWASGASGAVGLSCGQCRPSVSHQPMPTTLDPIPALRAAPRAPTSTKSIPVNSSERRTTPP